MDPLAPLVVEGLCQVQNNTVMLKFPLGTDDTTSYDNPLPVQGVANSNGLRFVFSTGGENPLSEKDSGRYYVDTYALVDEVPYQIDKNYFDNVFTPTRGTVGMIIDHITSYQTYDAPMNYTFKITPTKKYPEHTAITIEIPPVITALSSKVPRCTYIVKDETMVSVTMATLEVSLRPFVQNYEQGQTLKEILAPRIIINITDMFTSRWYLDPGIPLYVICENFRNPRTTRETATFKIHVQDSLGYYIENLMTGILTQMTQKPIIPYFEVTMSNFTNGDVNTYGMRTISPLPHFNGDFLQFQFPTQIILKVDTQCTALGVLKLIKCTRLTQNLVQAEMFFQSDYIEPYTEIVFQFLEVQNSPDTRLSSPFSRVNILDPKGYLLTSYFGKTTLQTRYFAIVQEKILKQSNYSLYVQSDYIITYKTVNRMPAGASFQIWYPETVQPPVQLVICRIQVGNEIFDLFGCNVNLENLFIVITGGFNADVAAGQELTITFGPITTPISQLNPGKFTMKAYTDGRLLYLIDEIPEGLIPTFDCDYPCRRCTNSYTIDSSRIDCINCQTNQVTERRVYLENQRCIEKCPDGKFGDLANDKICTFCPDSCLTCQNFVTCTSCKQNSDIPELNNNWCYTTCPEALCSINFKCLTCQSAIFSYVDVTPNPQVVGKMSQITFVANLESSDQAKYANNDIVWLLIPSPGFFYISNDTSQQWRIQVYKDYYSITSLCESLTPEITVDYCTIYRSRVRIKILTSSQNLKSVKFRIANFQNPSTTRPIPSIKSFLTDANNNQKAHLLTTILVNLQPETINNAVLTPQSQIIGASNLLIQVQFTTKNVLETDQQIWVTFPYWNPRSDNPQHMIRNYQPNCIGTLPIKLQLTCVYEKERRILRVSQFYDTQLPINTFINFTVDSFVNPFNSIEKSGFQITTMESSGIGKIDESAILSINVNQSAALQYPTVQRGDQITTVGELSSLTFSFHINLPVDPDCRIGVTFPIDQPLTEDLNSSTGTNLFQSAYGISAFNKVLNYVEVSGCPEFSDASTANQTNQITLSNILNIGWVKDTLPFKLQLFAVQHGNNYIIAEVQLNTMIVSSLMLTRGMVLQLKIEQPTDIQEAGNIVFRFTIQPAHSIPSANKIKIKFPTGQNGIKLASPCLIKANSQSNLVDPASAQCTVNVLENTISLVNAFGQNGQFTKASNAFSFELQSGGQIPGSSCDFIQYEASTYYIMNNDEYPIDYSLFNSQYHKPPIFDPYLPKPPILMAQLLNQSGNFISSYEPVSYFFKVTAKIPIPNNGNLQITMPKGSTRLPFDVNQINCTSFYQNIKVYEYSTPDSRDPLKFKLNQFIQKLGGYGSGIVDKEIIIQCDGLWNPRATNALSSISIQINNNQDCPVELIDQNMLVTINTIPEFRSIRVYNDEQQNGRLSTFTFELEPSVVFYDLDYLVLNFPIELTLPATPVCDPGTYLKNVTCSQLSHNQLKAVFTLKSPVQSQEYLISFRVFNVKNSANTQLSGSFSDFKAFDMNDNLIQTYSKSDIIRVQNTKYSVGHGNLSQSNNEVGAITDYTISYHTMNSMQPGASFKINYPPTVHIPPELLKPNGDLLTCQITYSTVIYQMRCALDFQEREIKVHSGLTISIPEGALLEIKLGLIQNPETPLSVSTFQLTSYTDYYQNFIIDRVLENMVPQYQCEYPCATCPSQQQRIKCLSCFTTEVPKYLYQNYCFEKCPYPLIPNQFYVCSGPTIEFTAELLNISNYQAAYEPAKYTLEIKPLKIIPDGTVMQIDFPIELGLATGAANLKCDTYAKWYGGQTFLNSGKVTLKDIGPPVKVEFTGLFLSKAQFDLGTNIIIVCDQLRNPKTLDAAGAFKVSMSHPSAPTTVVSTGMQIKMTSLPNFIQFLIEPLGLTTGMTTEFRFTLKAPQTIASDSKLRIKIPLELGLPGAIICSLASQNLQSIACLQEQQCINRPFASTTEMISVPTGIVQATFKFISSAGVLENESISFVISNIGNPSSTKPVKPNNVTLYNQNGVIIAQMKEDIPSFSIQTASEVLTKSLSLDSYELQALTGLMIQYTAPNNVAVNSIIVISYPLTANFQGSVDIACSLTVNSIGYAHNCRLDRPKREIIFTLQGRPGQKITNNIAIPQNSVVQLTVKEFRNYAKRLGLSTDAFKVRIYTDNTRVYGIDKISTGLTLYTCADGYYHSSGQCIVCDVSCKKCRDAPDKCTECPNNQQILDDYKCYTVCQ